MFDTEIWPPGVLIATEVTLLLGHLRRQSKERHVSVITMYLHISISFLTSNHVCLH